MPKRQLRTAVKKMIDFVFFIFRLFTFDVLRMFCRIRDFFLLLADLIYDENFRHLCFISPNSNWMGYKGIFALHIPICIWLGINFQSYTSYLFW